MFLSHFDVFCDLLLSGRRATWNLFVLYDNEINFISYLLRFSEIFSSNHSRESTFSHVGKTVSSNQKSAVRMNQSVRKRVHVVFGASSIFIHRRL